MREKVCVLAKSKREAVAWCRQNGVNPRHMVFPLTADRIAGVYFSKVVVLPSFERVRNRQSILRTLKRKKRGPQAEWTEVETFHPDQTTIYDHMPPELDIPFKLPEPSPSDQGGVSVFTKVDTTEYVKSLERVASDIAAITALYPSEADSAANEETSSKTDSQASPDSMGSDDDDPMSASEVSPPHEQMKPKPFEESNPPKKKASAKKSVDLDKIFEEE